MLDDLYVVLNMVLVPILVVKSRSLPKLWRLPRGPSPRLPRKPCPVSPFSILRGFAPGRPACGSSRTGANVIKIDALMEDAIG